MLKENKKITPPISNCVVLSQSFITTSVFNRMCNILDTTNCTKKQYFDLNLSCLMRECNTSYNKRSS